MTDIKDRKQRLKEIVQLLKPAVETAVESLRELSDNLEEDALEADETEGGDEEPYNSLQNDLDEQIDELESVVENLEGLYDPKS